MLGELLLLLLLLSKALSEPSSASTDGGAYGGDNMSLRVVVVVQFPENSYWDEEIMKYNNSAYNMEIQTLTSVLPLVLAFSTGIPC
jgi:hypothetical protein